MQTFFVFGLLQAFLGNRTFGGRQTDPEAGAPSCLGSYFEFRFFLLRHDSRSQGKIAN
jgi:hypothetical protein